MPLHPVHLALKVLIVAGVVGERINQLAQFVNQNSGLLCDFACCLVDFDGLRQCVTNRNRDIQVRSFRTVQHFPINCDCLQRMGSGLARAVLLHQNPGPIMVAVGLNDFFVPRKGCSGPCNSVFRNFLDFRARFG